VTRGSWPHVRVHSWGLRLLKHGPVCPAARRCRLSRLQPSARGLLRSRHILLTERIFSDLEHAAKGVR